MSDTKKNIVAQNRKARFDYHLEEITEAGIVLLGSEVKSLREGKASISDAYAAEQDGEIYMLNAHIAEYKNSANFNHDPSRPRKLLLHSKQIKKLIGKLKIKGLTLVVLSIYFNRKNVAKAEIALAKGKTLYDKRETEKKQDWQRSQSRIMRDKYR